VLGEERALRTEAEASASESGEKLRALEAQHRALAEAHDEKAELFEKESAVRRILEEVTVDEVVVTREGSLWLNNTQNEAKQATLTRKKESYLLPFLR